MIPGIKPTTDFAFKKIFATEERKWLLRHFLNTVVLAHLGDAVFGEAVRGLTLSSPFSQKEFEQDKQVIHDILAVDQVDRRYQVEMQQLAPFYTGLRAVFSWARTLTGQMGESQHYATLMATHSIWILGEKFLPDDHYYHRFAFTCQETGLVLWSDGQIHVLELPKFILTPDQLKRPLECWMYFFQRGQDLDSENLPVALRQRPYQTAMEVLVQIAQNQTDRDLCMLREKAARDAMPHDLIVQQVEASALKRGHESGFVQGVGQGRKEGIDQGRKEGTIKGEVIGMIRLAQGVLRQPQTPREELENLPDEELARRWAVLKPLVSPDAP